MTGLNSGIVHKHLFSKRLYTFTFLFFLLFHAHVVKFSETSIFIEGNSCGRPVQVSTEKKAIVTGIVLERFSL